MTATPRLLRFDAVKERVPYSRAVLYAKIAKGEFPRPIKIGDRAVAWISTEVDAFIETLIADARGGQPDGTA
jgi:prophage regulatory protein